MNQNQSRYASSTHGRRLKSLTQRKAQDSGQSSSYKSGSSSRKRSSASAPDPNEESEAGGMSGLPEYCTTCEKQIMTPGGSILYCSDRCRKKDTTFRPLAMQTAFPPPANIPSSAASYFDVPGPDIVPQRSPTVLRPASMIFSDFSTSEPASPSYGSDESDGNGTSEAARYLAQFHSQRYDGERVRPRRPRTNRIPSTTDGVPSLSHTPSSSIGTAVSVDRPLPQGHGLPNDRFSSRSMDLVVASYAKSSSSNSRYSTGDASVESSVSTATTVRMTDERDKSFERRDLSRDDLHEGGSGLKQLFSHHSVQDGLRLNGMGYFQRPDGDELHETATTGI